MDNLRATVKCSRFCVVSWANKVYPHERGYVGSDRVDFIGSSNGNGGCDVLSSLFNVQAGSLGMVSVWGDHK